MRQLGMCSARLGALPPPLTTEPFAHVLSLINSFCAEIATFTKGHLDHATLVQENRRSYARLKQQIRETTPYFIPYETVAQMQEFSNDSLLSDDSEEFLNQSPESYITLLHVRERIEK